MAWNKIKRLLAGGLAAVVMTSLCGCSILSEEKSTAEYIQSGKVTSSGYRTAEVYEGSFNLSYIADARVSYAKRQSLQWENSEDRYGELLVQPGDQVKKGDVIATFQVTSVSESDIMERELAIEEAQNSLSQTRQSYEKAIAQKKSSMKDLENEDYEIARLELAKLQSEYEQQVVQAEHQIESLEEMLDELLEKKEDNKLLAPFDGEIAYVNRSFQKGNKVDAYTDLVIIEDLDSQVVTFTNNSYYGTVPYLSRVMLTDRVTKDTYEGTVVTCGNVTGMDSDEIIVELDEPIAEERLDAMFEVTGFTMQKENVILVDNKAITKEGNDYYVYILNENNATYKTYVSIGGVSNDGMAWITEGLSAGQTVILE